MMPQLLKKGNDQYCQEGHPSFLGIRKGGTLSKYRFFNEPKLNARRYIQAFIKLLCLLVQGELFPKVTARVPNTDFMDISNDPLTFEEDGGTKCFPVQQSRRLVNISFCPKMEDSVFFSDGFMQSYGKKKNVERPCYFRGVTSSVSDTALMDIVDEPLPLTTEEYGGTGFFPIVKSRTCADVGHCQKMEDIFVYFNDYIHIYGLKNCLKAPDALYEVITTAFKVALMDVQYEPLTFEKDGGSELFPSVRAPDCAKIGFHGNVFACRDDPMRCCDLKCCREGQNLYYEVTTASVSEPALPDIADEPSMTEDDGSFQFFPVLRSAGWGDIGTRQRMEDVFVCFDDFMDSYGLMNCVEGPNAFYGVFDGHGGKHAAEFVGNNLPRYIAEGKDFPFDIIGVVSSAFSQTDLAFAEACSLDSALESGTTALAAVVLGRSLVVANIGDCRAVLSCKGKAVQLSRDHRPDNSKERTRIEASGGYVDDGYLNGELGVARALGDWHIEGLKTQDGLGPLSAEPEFESVTLTEDDEFLIIGCDGIWEVFRSQNAVDFARRRLQEHNDPDLCCKELVEEALKRNSSDNLTVVVVCFQSGPPPAISVPKWRSLRNNIANEGLQKLQALLDN